MILSPLAVSTLTTPSPLENLLALVFAAIAVFFVAMMLVSVTITALAPLAPLVPKLWGQLTSAPRTRREKRKERVLNRALAKIEAEESEVIRARIIARVDINALFESSNADSDLLAQELAA